MPTPRDRRLLEAVATHGRLTRHQIQRLFFRRQDGLVASRQAANARLKKLTDARLLSAVVVSTGRGGGPYAYGLGPVARALLDGAGPIRATGVGPVWHQLEIAEFHVRLGEALLGVAGQVVEWQGEVTLRRLLKDRRGWPQPDALVHWRLRGFEGAFALEWDRGTEPLAVLTAKLSRYERFWRGRGSRDLLPGLGLRTRLAIVVPSHERMARVITWIVDRSLGATVLVGQAFDILADPLGPVWWRSDHRDLGRLTE